MFEILIIHLILQYNGFKPSSAPIINGSYSNITSLTQLFTLTNASTGGLEGIFMMLILFLVFACAGIIAGKLNPILSLLGASLIMTVIAVLAQTVGIVGSIMPLVFISLSVIMAMLSLLKGFTKTFE